MSAVTRDALIEAGTEAIRRKWDLPYRSIDPHVTDDVRKVLDAVLPMLGLDSDSLPVPVVECPNCGASIRARMPDDPDA